VGVPDGEPHAQRGRVSRRPRHGARLSEPPSPPEGAFLSLRPRWLWIAFVVIALAVPLVGLLLERRG
jgi:hypothetical protein